MEQKYFYTWREFDEDVEKIARWTQEKGFQNIYGVPRGGLVLAIALSHRLGLSLTLRIEEIVEDTLVVDDFTDSGKTLTLLSGRLSFRPIVATLFYEERTDGRQILPFGRNPYG